MGVGTARVRPVAPPGGFLRALGDERLVARVRGGDDRAFEAIYDRHHRALLSFCRHMLGSREEAEDALQHSFASAYRSLRASDSPIQLKAWLYAIARNQCLSILRARREQVPLDDVAPATDGLADEVERRGELRELLGDLQRLPDEQRAALVLAELGAHSHEEIAVILGVRKDKVKALVFQARESLATSRRARDTSCREIQEQLSVLRGGALRRGSIRRHVQACAACQAFRTEVARQRAAMAVVLPVAPSLALKSSILGPLVGGAAGTAALGAGALGGLGGSAASAGGGLSLAGKSLAAKALVATAVAGSVGGGTAVVEELRHHDNRTGPTHAAPPAPRPTPAAPVAGEGAQSAPAGKAAVPAPAVEGERRRGRGRRRTAGAGMGGQAAPPPAPLPGEGLPAAPPPPGPIGAPAGAGEAPQAEHGRPGPDRWQDKQAREEEHVRKQRDREAERAQRRQERARQKQARDAERARRQQAREEEHARKQQAHGASKQQAHDAGKQQAHDAGKQQAGGTEQAAKQHARAPGKQTRHAGKQGAGAEQAAKKHARGPGKAAQAGRKQRPAEQPAAAAPAQPQGAGANGPGAVGPGAGAAAPPTGAGQPPAPSAGRAAMPNGNGNGKAKGGKG